MNKNPNEFYKFIVIGVIVLFIGVGIQPAFANYLSIEPVYSELVEITVEIYEVNRIMKYTLILTQEQAEDLELVINNTKSELDKAEDSEDIENIFMNTVLSLNELNLLPNDMSVEEMNRLVTGEEQNQRIVNFLERYYNNNQKSLDNNENILCLIAGDTINTIFAGSFPILVILRCLVLGLRVNLILGWLSNFPKLSDLLSPYLGSVIDIFFSPRVSFWLLFGAKVNFNPIKFGALMLYGWLNISFIPWYPSEWIPASGWVNTNGLGGKKELSGNFYGSVLGFTGIKITRDLRDHFYLGAALRVRINNA